MSFLRTLYRRLDLLQEKLAVRVALSVLIVVACGWYFGSLLATSISLESQRTTIREAITGQSLAAQDPLAVEFAQNGTVTIDGQTWGGRVLTRNLEFFFDDEGRFNVGLTVKALLSDRQPTGVGAWMAQAPDSARLLLIVSLVFGLLVVWMRLALQFVLTVIGTGIVALLCRLAGAEGLMTAVIGIGLLTFTFILLTRAALILLNRTRQVPSVAHTLVHEASRIKLSLSFIILLLVLLPLIPLWISEDIPLRFQIQSFISWSLTVTYVMAAVLTLFLSTATVAFEIRDRQIWQLMTKPVSRFSYLMGKWVGVMTINLILIVVAGVSIFTYIQYLSQKPVQAGDTGLLDLLAVQEQVLTARVGAYPAYEELTSDQLRARVDEKIAGDPDLSRMEEVPAATRRQIGEELQTVHLAAQRSIPAQRARNYRFTGLEKAKELGETLTLRFRFYIGESSEHESYKAAFMFSGYSDTYTEREYVPTIGSVVPVQAQFIKDDGTLDVLIANMEEETTGRNSMRFEAEDLELLYKVGGFEGNFLRAMLVTWIKLAFLAALGIAAATFLSFPVACLFTFTVFLAGTMGPFLATALEQYYPPELDRVDFTSIPYVLQWLVQTITRGIAQFLVYALSGFGEYRPKADLVDGRLIPWSAVGVGVLKIGVIWSGVALLTGFAVLRRRELATYSGHG